VTAYFAWKTTHEGHSATVEAERGRIRRQLGELIAAVAAMRPYVEVNNRVLAVPHQKVVSALLRAVPLDLPTTDDLANADVRTGAPDVLLNLIDNTLEELSDAVYDTVAKPRTLMSD
jgi:hypothetical protein